MKKIIVLSGVVALVVLAILIIKAPSDREPASKAPENVSEIHDAHGIAVDIKDPTKLYIATHSGLLLMDQNGSLQRVGSAQDDYMGFSPHPTDQNIFYTSGHPSSGGNLGFQKSTDGGVSWKKISDGANGPVDFHTMTVGQIDPAIIFGLYGGKLQRSTDEGKNWEVLEADISNVITLKSDVLSKETVYAGTARGLYVSRNSGQDWLKVGNYSDPVTALAINPKQGQELTMYVQGEGLVRSIDGGVQWSKISNYTGPMVMHIAYNSKDTSNLYLINQSLEIFKTKDSADTWQKIR